jgi:hypothetical protein
VKGLSRLPVTEEIAGSNPVERAKKKYAPFGGYFFFVIRYVIQPAIQAIQTSVLNHNKRAY